MRSCEERPLLLSSGGDWQKSVCDQCDETAGGTGEKESGEFSSVYFATLLKRRLSCTVHTLFTYGKLINISWGHYFPKYQRRLCLYLKQTWFFKLHHYNNNRVLSYSHKLFLFTNYNQWCLLPCCFLIAVKHLPMSHIKSVPADQLALISPFTDQLLWWKIC